MKTTKLVCPQCGAEIAIPEHESFVAGIAIGKDSGLGTVTLPLAHEERTVADVVSTLNHKDGVTAFPVSVGDDERVGIVEDGVIHTYDLNDPVVLAILGEGTVPNNRLFRRFVLAQLMRAEMQYNGGIQEMLNSRGWEYLFKVLENEYYAQWKMYDNGDLENFEERNMFFNKVLAVNVANDLKEIVYDEIEEARKDIHTCWRKPYINFLGKYMVYTSEIDSKVIKPLRNNINRVCDATTPKELYEAFAALRKMPVLTTRNKYEKKDAPLIVPNDYKLPFAFVDAFKAVGGYAAAKNMIMFSGARVHGVLDEEKSLYALNECLERAMEYGGYVLIGFWRELCKDNNWDFKEKFAQWKAERIARRSRK